MFALDDFFHFKYIKKFLTDIDIKTDTIISILVKNDIPSGQIEIGVA